jgi:hypothetical protein
MSDTTNPGERGRFSATRKGAAVLRLLRSESLELLAKRFGDSFRQPEADSTVP